MLSALILSLSLAAPPAAAPAPATLFYLQPQKSGACAAVAHDVAANKPRTLFEVAECPSTLLFSLAKQKVIYTAKQHIWIRPLDDAKAAPTDLGALPKEELASLYLVEGSRNIRAATLVPLDDKAVKKKGEQVTYLFEGKEHAAEGVPPWGTPYMAILQELDGKGQWKRVQMKPTTSEAGDTLGAAVLDTNNAAKDVVSLGKLASLATCVGGVLACDVEDKAALKLVGKKDDSSVGVLMEGGSARLAFRVLFGDTPHAVPPLFICQKGCATGTQLDEKRDQVAISARGPYLLITDEYSGDAPVVFDANGKVVLRIADAKGTVWWPAP